jgi:hypothetical protein
VVADVADTGHPAKPDLAFHRSLVPYRYHALAAQIMHLKTTFFQRNGLRLTNATARIDLIFAGNSCARNSAEFGHSTAKKGVKPRVSSATVAKAFAPGYLSRNTRPQSAHGNVFLLAT